MASDGTAQLHKDLDFADDEVLVSSKNEHIQNKTDQLVDNAGRVELKQNAEKKMQSDGNECTQRRQSEDWKRVSGTRRRVCLSRCDCDKG